MQNVQIPPISPQRSCVLLVCINSVHFICRIIQQTTILRQKNDSMNISSVGWTNFFREFHGQGLDRLKFPRTGPVGLIWMKFWVDLDESGNFLSGGPWWAFEKSNEPYLLYATVALSHDMTDNAHFQLCNKFCSVSIPPEQIYWLGMDWTAGLGNSIWGVEMDGSNAIVIIQGRDESEGCIATIFQHSRLCWTGVMPCTIKSSGLEGGYIQTKLRGSRLT